MTAIFMESKGLLWLVMGIRRRIGIGFKVFHICGAQTGGLFFSSFFWIRFFLHNLFY
jgi:hypothetical protein